MSLRKHVPVRTCPWYGMFLREYVPGMTYNKLPDWFSQSLVLHVIGQGRGTSSQGQIEVGPLTDGKSSTLMASQTHWEVLQSSVIGESF